MERQYCASVYIIDFEAETILLMYNKKLEKWLQPGGHIENMELPFETCLREAKEETGIDVSLLNNGSFTSFNYQPVYVEHYKNKVGDMIDFQFVAFPLNKKLSNNSENNLVKWQNISNIDTECDIDDEIKFKAKFLFNTYRETYFLLNS